MFKLWSHQINWFTQQKHKTSQTSDRKHYTKQKSVDKPPAFGGSVNTAWKHGPGVLNDPWAQM